MHMADSLITPVVGGTMWAASAGLLMYSSKKIMTDDEESMIPMMGVLGAFVFAAQMINFTIPGTGSSGHIGGGMLLAILLGPYAAFLVISSVLVIQALFFADGGLMALGCNIFNLGFFPCFLAYPLIYKPLAGNKTSLKKIWPASIIATIVGLQLGALAVVLETVASGISELPFKSFLVMMQPIHLAIGIIEGIITASVISIVYQAKPDLQTNGVAFQSTSQRPNRLPVGLLIAACLIGGTLSWFASANPDGLEWAIFKTTGTEEVAGKPSDVQRSLENVQTKTAFLPDYDYKVPAHESAEAESSSWPAVSSGTSVSGIIGSLITLALIVISALLLKQFKRKQLPA